jgi:hypothetical protein
MIGSFFSLLAVCVVLMLVQVVAALPWLLALRPTGRDRAAALVSIFAGLAGVVVIGGPLLAAALAYDREPGRLELYGRWFAAVLHVQLAIDLIALAFAGLLLVWPKGGAVALAAFREGVRQPMFWVIVLAAGLFLFVSTVIPYFTFGDDFKFYKQIGFDVIMLAAMLFGVLGASLSVYEEIEGRTAITLMSKPVTRRQFLLGKYVGILAAAGVLTLLLGWLFNWSLYAQPRFLSRLDEVSDPMPEQLRASLGAVVPKLTSDPVGRSFLTGNADWWGDTVANHLGLLLGFGQVSVLLAVAVALGTRLPFVANLLVCLGVFFLGHLSPVLAKATAPGEAAAVGAVPGRGGQAVQLVHFVARVSESLFPSLDYFSNSSAVIRENPIEVGPFALYVGSVLVYALGYAIVAMLIGLILFEDRDLA